MTEGGTPASAGVAGCTVATRNYLADARLAAWPAEPPRQVASSHQDRWWRVSHQPEHRTPGH